jgi:hypothetical protein
VSLITYRLASAHIYTYADGTFLMRIDWQHVAAAANSSPTRKMSRVSAHGECQGCRPGDENSQIRRRTLALIIDGYAILYSSRESNDLASTICGCCGCVRTASPSLITIHSRDLHRTNSHCFTEPATCCCFQSIIASQKEEDNMLEAEGL